MTDHDKKRFAVVMSMLGYAFDREPNKKKMRVYFETLKSCSIESVEHAAKEAVKRCKFFPAAAELMELTATHRTPPPEPVRQLIEPSTRETAKKNLAEIQRILSRGTIMQD